MPSSKLRLMETMNQTYLIQRLEKPTGVISVFDFGCGLPNGGLSRQAANAVSSIFRFSYMGSAQFEWGAVPAALAFITEQANAGAMVAGSHLDVFYICPKTYEVGVKTVIQNLLSDEYSMRLLDPCYLSTSVQAMKAEKAVYSVGWLELDNGYFFFIDETMFESTKKFFGMK